MLLACVLASVLSIIVAFALVYSLVVTVGTLSSIPNCKFVSSWKVPPPAPGISTAEDGILKNSMYNRPATKRAHITLSRTKMSEM